ncbi:Mov34/MPN/PAD-1 family protein [Onchocerca flexuosa]|uniref:Mov34/MPN/PAD-1 family protein n=1 Tax=Onchocerca flexuosa TaxID=387005 RepID=A0A238BUP8_9BILA|nr:Mov34/MPN/PAD-1 family protein [Onchocerca flexuosa]
MAQNIDVICDPNLRMRITLNMASTQEVSPTVPINRFDFRVSFEQFYYRSLNEIYRVAGFCMEDKDYERAFIYYMRFVSLTVEGLPKHKQYKGFSSAEKTKAETVLRDAFMKAEALKERLKKKYEEEAILAKQNLERASADYKLHITPSVIWLIQNAALIRKKDASSDHDVKTRSGFLDTADYKKSCSAAVDSRILDHKEVVVAGDLVENFVRLAQINTSRNVETCGILCGSLISGGVCRITHAVVPKQTGAADSCDTHNEEEVFAYQDVNNLITLGWIHTHPSQTAFLSSVDLHTHCSYQLMLSEAIAIVVAPKFNEVGIFRLSERGMKEISGCRKTGFHPHEDSAALFFYCHDVRFENSLAAVVVDLR